MHYLLPVLFQYTTTTWYSRITAHDQKVLYIQQLVYVVFMSNGFIFVFCVGLAVIHRMYCSLSRLPVLTPLCFPLSPPEALHINQRKRPLSAKGGTMGKKCPIKFSHTIATSMVIVGFFYMLQSCDMGPTACWGFFRPKNPMASDRFEPTNLGTRGQHANH
jgi:hypothetical protein